MNSFINDIFERIAQKRSLCEIDTGFRRNVEKCRIIFMTMKLSRGKFALTQCLSIDSSHVSQ
ncbi:unnamed protein product [Tetraodon nigroviridis]|uniref:(spotted green pufferfish) hypothetical protein n=1 Tax=Tetraodon nigroviridis TaxID=99883 RepID=Q4SJC1_TETNG|nr:unnamed protein product [Tetraodon nigroviridis]